MPIRIRLTMFAALGAVALCTVGGFVFLGQLRAGLLASVDSSLRTRADALVQNVRDAARGGIDFQDSGSTALLPAREAIVQFLTPTGHVAESSEAAGPRTLLPRTLAGTARQRTVSFEGRVPTDTNAVRFLATPVVRADGHWTVIVGTSLEGTDSAIARVRSELLIAGAIAVAVAAAGAWLLARLALRPVERMRRQASTISELGNSTPLLVPNTHDEITELGTTMATLLDRLQSALTRQRAFVADASHELRTPLAILRTELELAARADRSAAELRQAIIDATAETDRLTRLAEQLLFLARYDETATSARGVVQSLAPLLDRACAVARSRASARTITISLTMPPELTAEILADDLRRAVDNLIDNALQYAPPNSSIDVSAARVGSDIEITVSDEGPGFPAGFLPHAFERFRRADDARSRGEYGGSGLGLAIVRAVAREHGGDADAQNRDDHGAVVRLRIRARG